MDTIKKSTNSITIANKSKESLKVIVEYIHWVTDILPENELRIFVEGNNDVNVFSFFDIEYHNGNIIVMLNNDIEYAGKYKVSFLANEEAEESFVL